MNIHINKNTRLQPWEGKAVFSEYLMHIRPGNFTVTLLFHDREVINDLHKTKLCLKSANSKVFWMIWSGQEQKILTVLS